MNLEKQAQKKAKTQIWALIFDKASIVIAAEYSNYNNIFLGKYVAELLEYIGINNYTIKLESGK